LRFLDCETKEEARENHEEFFGTAEAVPFRAAWDWAG
jgi:hypothetical protein